MNLLMESVSALPPESPALQRWAMRQIVEAYFGITPSSGYRSMCQRPGYPGDRPYTNSTVVIWGSHMIIHGQSYAAWQIIARNMVNWGIVKQLVVAERPPSLHHPSPLPPT